MNRPDEALERLREGNTRFVRGEHEHPNLDHDRRHETRESGQEPFAAILSCSDSRGPVEMVFDQGIGDIFSIRNAGNTCDTGSLGSMEIGIYKFNIPLLVVLGHTDCGAVKLAIDNKPLHGNMSVMIDRIVPVVNEVSKKHPDLQGDDFLVEVTRENSRIAVRKILDRSSVIREKVEKGELKIVPALHRLRSGRVEWFE